ncbi:DUF1385 domain-containing protein [bacterium]
MSKKLNIGGQAVIEGVMMRSPKYYSIALRKKDGTIITKLEPFKSITQKKKFLDKAFIRGIIALFETIVLGVKTLSFSADEYMKDYEEDEKKEVKPKKEGKINWELTLTIITSFAFGIALFVALPLFLANIIKGFWQQSSHYIVYNAIDGIMRLLVFLIYVVAISFLKDIQRVFQYHGAEHKSVFAYENGLELNVENVKKYGTLHPRCGTNFMLVVIVLSIFVISVFKFDTFLHKFLVRLVVLPLVASLSYEVIRFLGKHHHKKWAKILLWPGLFLQKLTTKEPDNEQIEVAINALNAVVIAEASETNEEPVNV